MGSNVGNKSTHIVETALSGYELLNDPLLNKGTAFTESERDEFDLHGLLPPHVAELDYQVKRRLDAFRGLGTELHVQFMGELYPVTVESIDATSLFDPSNERIRS